MKVLLSILLLFSTQHVFSQEMIRTNISSKNLYVWNGTDIGAFVNPLKINEHRQTDLIIAQHKKIQPISFMYSHSLTIMDTDVTKKRWILGLSNRKATDKKEQHFFNDVLTKADYLEDLNQLVDSIKIYHPQPYEFISENDFNASVNQKKNMITDSTSIRQFSWICNSIAALPGCLHTRTHAGNILNISPDMFFPVKAQFVDSKLYVTASSMSNVDVKPGIEILKINGVDVLELKKGIASHISSDGYNLSFIDAVINKNFDYFCSAQLNFPTIYQIVIREDGVKKEIRLQKEPSNNVPNLQSPNLDFSIEPSENLAIITIKSFVYYEDRLPIFKSFVDSCFSQIGQNNINNLVVDLRSNGGGDPYCAAYLLQYISDKPFRYYKEGTTDYYKDLEEEIKPLNNNFSGDLYVLINPLCCSTTGHLSSILKYNNLGTLIGSETGATYSCNAKTINFKLKNTGINASVATKTYQTAVTDMEKNRGIRPAYLINRSLEELLGGKDLEMEKVIELIHKE